MRRIMKKVLAVFITAAMLLTQTPASFAGGPDPVGIDLNTVRTNGSGYTVDWEAGLLTITGDGSYRLTANGDTTTHVVVEAKNAHITLSNLTIWGWGTNIPFSIKSGSTVNLTLEGNNVLKFTDESICAGAGLHVPVDAAVVIDGSGSLTATGKKTGAGVGGMGAGGDAGRITINSGTVTANGGPYAAGIGGGNNDNGTAAGNGGHITINGGSVTATGGTHAAGIGGGCRGDGGNIVINGGTVNAIGYHSAAIGGGFTGNTGDIRIAGGFVTATAGSIGAGIGRAAGDGNSSGGGSILVSGGTVFAKGIAAGMPGLGGWGSCVDGEYTSTDTTTLQITGGSVRSIPAPVVAPSGADSLPIYLTTISVEGANNSKVANKDLHYKLNGGGLISARTDEAGKLYLWLAAGTHALEVVIDGQLYQTDLGVSAQNGNPHTLTANPDDSFVPVERIGWMGANGPVLTAGVPLDLSGILEITPHNATYDSILWSIEDAGGTGAMINGTELTASNPGTIGMKATIKRFGVTLNSWTASVAVKAAGGPAAGEQFDLTPGSTYYFDLSGQGIEGTLAALGNPSASGSMNPNLPDGSLHWVPFTYTGTVNAYSRASAGVSTEGDVSVRDHSLFVANYNVAQAAPWDSLNGAGLIFGKGYSSGGVSYQLRSLSVGSSYTGTEYGDGEATRGIPASNEWDQILNKNAGFIKNWNGLYSLGQDTASGSSILYGARGNNSARSYYNIFGGSNHGSAGFRPALEITSTPATEMKTVIFNMGGNGTLGNGALTSATVVYTGALVLPEITPENGFKVTAANQGTPGWYAGSTFYAPGAAPTLAAGTILTLGYDPAPDIMTSTLPNGTKDVPYSQTLTATGSTPITWSLDNSTLLPAGLLLNANTGEISGTPTTEGTSTFTVKAENSVRSVTKQLSITIDSDQDLVAVTAASAKAQNAVYHDMTQAEAISEAVIADAMKTIAAAAVNDNSVAVAINKVSYTAPTAGTAGSPNGTNGSFAFTVTVERGAQGQTTGEKTISITATVYTGISDTDAVAAAKAALADGAVNVAHGATQTDKTAAVQSYVNGLLNAVPNAAGVTAVVAYSSGNQYNVALSKGSESDSMSITMTVNEAASGGTAPAIITQALKIGTVGEPYSDSLAATGDTPITWSIESGSLPSMLNLTPDGKILGIPLEAGTFTFTVKAENDAGFVTQTLTITVRSLQYVAFGDSIAVGYGLSNYADSYVSIVKARLGLPAANVAMTGLNSAQLLEMLNELSAQPGGLLTNTKVITLSIGSNDVLGAFLRIMADQLGCNVNAIQSTFAGLSPAEQVNVLAALNADDGSGLKDNPALQGAADGFSPNFRTIISELKALAPNAEIYVTNEYNPYQGISIPYGAGTLELGAITDGYINTLNSAFDANSSDYTLIDVYSAFSTKLSQGTSPVNANLQTFNFDPHPNAAGHALIADLILAACAVPETPQSQPSDGRSGGGGAAALKENPVTDVKISAEQSTTIKAGGKVVITVPSVPNAAAYTVELPAETLSGATGQGSLTMRTEIGSMVLPANMLANMGAAGKTAELSISAGDRAALSEAARTAVGDHPLIKLTLKIDGKEVSWNNPEAPVAVSIPYTPPAAELANPEGIVIWYIDGNGNAVSVPNGHYDPAAGTVTFTTTHFSDYAVGYHKVSFSDVPANAWYGKAVSFLAARDITTGTGNGNYSPKAALTRGEFIVMLMKAYGIAPDTNAANANAANNFSDAGNTYYTNYLAAAKRLGVSNGVGGDRFAPGRQITRQEMFTLLYNALKVMGHLPEGNKGKDLAAFSDSGDIAPWAKDAMALLVKTGTAGGSGGKLSSKAVTTRAEMAQVLYNLLSK